MKPRKKWQPDYRFGGNPAAALRPAPLGTKSGWGPLKTKLKRRKK